MRFKRFEPYRPYAVTARKVGALVRRQARERDALPLFADQVAEEQPSIDQAMAARAERWARAFAADRLREAGNWRRGRREIAALPAAERRRFMAYWQRQWAGPLTASYLLMLLNMLRTGRLADMAEVEQ